MRRWVLPVIVALLALPAVRTGAVEHGALAEALGSTLGVLSGLTLVARRSHPLVVAPVVGALYAGDVLARGPVVPLSLTVAIYAVARYEPSPRGPLVAIAAALWAGAVVLVDDRNGVATSYCVVLLLVAVTGLLLAVRAGRRQSDRAAAVAAERVRLARDLHDVVGHGLSAITVQAGAARLAVAAGANSEAQAALNQIEMAGRQVLRDVRWMVGLLREDSSAPRLADLPALVDAARRAGLAASLETRGPVEGLGADAAEAVYRIVQEALTNALRHAGASAVSVQVTSTPQQLSVLVTDDGTTSLDEALEGNGIRGMRERAAVLGGSVEVGGRPDAPGWQVRVRMPVHRGRR